MKISSHKYNLIHGEILELITKRFWNKVKISNNPDQCYLWLGTTCSGYGSIAIPKSKGLYIYTHILAWYLSKNKWKNPDSILCHSCNNKTCVNFLHLYEGNAKTNANDLKCVYLSQPECKCGRSHH